VWHENREIENDFIKSDLLWLFKEKVLPAENTENTINKIEKDYINILRLLRLQYFFNVLSQRPLKVNLLKFDLIKI
jgi:hypothetical protein